MHWNSRLIAVVLIVSGLPAALFAEDVVVFTTGARATGKLIEVREDDREIDFEVRIGTVKLRRTYEFSRVSELTVDGERRVFGASSGTTPTGGNSSADDVVADDSPMVSRGEIERIIRETGGSAPDWFDATPLNYPDTLDVSWPLQPPDKQWNNQKNVGQYLWDVINPNPGRWRSGIRLIHHCMTLHQADSTLLQRDMKTIGSMYFRLFQDYPRAAFWFRRARVASGEPDSVWLAECYWRMGNRQMALELLDTQSFLPRAGIQMVKLFGDMGETARAREITRKAMGTQFENEACLQFADALRQAGEFDEARTYYQRLIDSDAYRNDDYEDRFKGRARDSMVAMELFDQLNLAEIGNGEYRGSSIGYTGQVDVEVTVAGGAIESVEVVRHTEKQFYSALTDTPAQIIDLQSVQGIDATSGATITSQAIVNATAKALAGGGR